MSNPVMTVKELRELIKDVPDDYVLGFYHDKAGLMFGIASTNVDKEHKELEFESDE